MHQTETEHSSHNFNLAYDASPTIALPRSTFRKYRRFYVCCHLGAVLGRSELVDARNVIERLRPEPHPHVL